jgi:hypothetical protein
MGYLADMKNGKDGEKLVKTLLESHGIEVQDNPARDKKGLTEYDLSAKLAYGEYKVEVKVDLRQSKTGNIALEYFNCKSCEPSGIFATTSDFWVFVLIDPVTIWLAKSAKIRDYMKKEKPLRDVSGGDDNSFMYLYKAEKILGDLFYRIDHLTSTAFNVLFTKLAHET